MNQPTLAPAPKTAPVYLIRSGELMLDRPLKEAWPLVIDYPSWQNYSKVEHVSGRPGEKGEVVVLHKEEEGFKFPPYCARTIKLEPERRVIWKTWPQGDEQNGDFFGIVDFTVQAVNDQTRFRVDMLYEFRVSYQDESELEEFRKQQDANFDALFSVVLPKLKKLAEKGA